VGEAEPVYTVFQKNLNTGGLKPPTRSGYASASHRDDVMVCNEGR